MVVECPKCHSTLGYEDGEFMICPECSHEWPKLAAGSAVPDSEDSFVVKDAYGAVLNPGDSITVIKDLKVKGSSLVVKVGTKAKNIKLIQGDHNIDCKLDGIGQMQLKSEFVKKA
ncbi:MAG: zinc ribbon domain-containing protein YjdM [Pseudomonadota bacterium]